MTNPLLDGWSPPARPTSPRPAGSDVTRLRLQGEITVESAIELFAEIRAAHADSIEIAIDSGGGNALCALALYELLITHPRQVVATVVGRCSSGAAIAAMGADRRRIATLGTVLLHPTTGPDEWREHVDELAVRIFADATGHAPHLIDAWHAAETTFDADEAVAAGLAHKVLAPREGAI